jgi:hypothetical protein
MPAPDERGGPSIDLRIRPSRAGVMRLFAQLRIDGQDLTARFVLVARE